MAFLNFNMKLFRNLDVPSRRCKIGGDVSCVPSKKKQLSLKNREVKLSPYLRIKIQLDERVFCVNENLKD